MGKLLIDTDNHRVSVISEEGEKMYPIGSREAFSLISRAMLRAGWDSKYVYSFTWMGRPIIQLPDDMLRIQELIYRVKPDVIIETGIAHGGSLVFYAGLLKAMGRGRVVGVDIEIRPHNRTAIEAHELYPLITLFEGDSVDLSIIDQLRHEIGPDERVLVFLDGNHTRDHVLEELRLYSEFVSVDSYIVAMDGIRKELVGAPRTEPNWSWDHPAEAAHLFLGENENFVLDEPRFPFNEGDITTRELTYWPDAFLKRIA